MNNYFVNIGLEIHTELNTNSKMFSCSINNINSSTNTNVNEIDLGMPGCLPSVNKAAVIKAIRLAKILNMEIEHNLKFDRKNYFYVDLPKGYQITQQYKPLGVNGELNGIQISRIHLEEDTAKQINVGSEIFLDYNRAGIPLIEIVTKPTLTGIDDTIKFLKDLRNILVFCDISDGKMEEGSFRVDVNISLSKNQNVLGTKIEIKNLNSFDNISNAITYEIKRLSLLINKNKKINEETRRWDGIKNQTCFMRSKHSEVDYRYLPEPNIIDIDISDLINSVNVPITPQQIKEQLILNNINKDIIELLLSNKHIFKCFDYLNKHIKNINQIVTWLIVELPPLMEFNNTSYENISPIFLDNIIKLINLIENNTLNNKQAKLVFEKMFLQNKDPHSLITELNLKQITDEQYIKEELIKIINENSMMSQQYKSRPERVEKMFIGLLMKNTKGQANPNISIKILRDLLNK